MIASPVGPATASCRRALVLAALALLAACAGRDPSVLRLAPHDRAGPMLALASGRSVTAAVDVEVFELGPALLPVPRAAWTEEARARVTPSLDALAKSRGVVLVQPPEPPDPRRERAIATLRDLVLTVTLRPLRYGFERASEEPGQVARIEPAPLSPSIVRALAEPIGTDFALFVFLRESRATETLRATNRRRLELGAPAGLSTSLFFGVATGYAVLVDLPRGRIVDARGFVAGDPSPSLADAAGTGAILRAVLDEPGA